MSHTYAVLEVSKATFDEVRQKLKEAGYEHAFHEDLFHDEVIDMHGIALQKEGSEVREEERG